MINKYFNNYNYSREQDIVEDLILESIKIYGHELQYLPRTIVNRDEMFGEDVLSKFEEAIPIEMYLKSVEGFEGDGQFLSKFGLEIRDQIVLTVARKRFDQAITSAKLMTEVGYNLIFEDGSTRTPSRQYLKQSKDTDSIELENNDYINENNRPQEGDLIFFPMFEKIYEIMSVDKSPILYQMGRLQVYDLRCEVFEYSSERIETGIDDIDIIEDKFSKDLLLNEILQENGYVLLSESSESLLFETQTSTNNQNTVDVSVNNDFFQLEADNIIDFSELSPFGEQDRW